MQSQSAAGRVDDGECGEDTRRRRSAVSKDSDSLPQGGSGGRVEAIESAAEVAAVGAATRLMIALAQRQCTQEAAAALFVAAARGLGCRARSVTALNPVPLRASAAALERSGILERQRDDDEGENSGGRDEARGKGASTLNPKP